MITMAEHRYFEAGATLADEVAASHSEPGFYTGEWSFRWRMAHHGWTFYTGQAPHGAVVVAPTHGSPGALPSGWEEIGRSAVTAAFPLRLVDDPNHVGLYAETLGASPLGWGQGPVEEVITWRVR